MTNSKATPKHENGELIFRAFFTHFFSRTGQTYAKMLFHKTSLSQEKK